MIVRCPINPRSPYRLAYLPRMPLVKLYSARMVQIIIRHVSGARATEVDVVPVGEHRELIFGRARSAAVRFHPQRDPRVGRFHARGDPAR